MFLLFTDTVRLCSYEYVEDNCKLTLTTKTHRKMNACTCNEDLCNKGMTFISPRYAIFGIVIALLASFFNNY